MQSNFFKETTHWKEKLFLLWNVEMSIECIKKMKKDCDLQMQAYISKLHIYLMYFCVIDGNTIILEIGLCCVSLVLICKSAKTQEQT